MSLILTFLGKGGSGRTTIAIAAAKKLASLGKRVLLAVQDTVAINLLLETPVTSEVQQIDTNLDAVHLKTSALLERNWEEVKKLEAQYLRTPVIKDVYGQELVVLPGMDKALELNALREYDASGKYDAIVYDGSGDASTLRMLGMPESLSWYSRRFGKLITESDLVKTVSPFLQPLIATVFNVSWTGDNFAAPTNQATNILEQGKAALADPKRLLAYLVTTDNPLNIATATYLWGSAQQVGLNVGGVLFNQTDSTPTTEDFSPLPISTIPSSPIGNWQPLIDALPDFTQNTEVPKPIEFDVVNRQVKLFLPGFDKKQVKLTQSGPEVTIEAGDQRRNIFLPPGLSGRTVNGAKFQQGYLIITL
ncbi:Get3/ArsA fold putative tail anchor-mediating ATPase NosAFP [Synechocystis sp. PCC 7509]|uniref:Get3/ArsA fold putative tail anchor-mediating ATPase NosAFP n=1 Tax=Synechocystis sp. PCC 7509 TaxID=927677 RepID=UPI0002AC2157|nr:ArsA family ATPase [Synechocystis sp. PCC 7509]